MFQRLGFASGGSGAASMDPPFTVNVTADHSVHIGYDGAAEGSAMCHSRLDKFVFCCPMRHADWKGAMVFAFDAGGAVWKKLVDLDAR